MSETETPLLNQQTATLAANEAIVRKASSIRALTLEQVLKQGGGYLGQACSSAEILATLIEDTLNLSESTAPQIPSQFTGVPGSKNPSPSGSHYFGEQNAKNDRFIVSPSHYAMAVYAMLISDGRLDRRALDDFNQDGSTMEMIGAEHSPGFEITSGSFGQAISQAAGIAWAKKQRGDTGNVWLFMSDGETQEGQTWEGIQYSRFAELDNLRIVVDVNGQQVDGRMENVMNVEPSEDRFDAFGATVTRVNGHDVTALREATRLQPTGGPLVILADTHPTTGIPSLTKRAHKLHYIRVLDDADRAELEQELRDLFNKAGQ